MFYILVGLGSIIIIVDDGSNCQSPTVSGNSSDCNLYFSKLRFVQINPSENHRQGRNLKLKSFYSLNAGVAFLGFLTPVFHQLLSNQLEHGEKRQKRRNKKLQIRLFSSSLHCFQMSLC